jgi:methyltransferase
MTAGTALLLFVTLQRALELLWARRNAERLRARGAVEAGAGHYRLMVLVHAAWLAGLWLFTWGRPLSVPWAGAYVALQAARFWVLATLGRRWTTRILVLPGAPLVRTGPYRYLDHPNYLVVAAEVAVLPLAFGLVGYAVVFSLLNGVVLAIRIRAENAALRHAETFAGQPHG